MEEVQFYNVVTGAGACLVIAGIAYLFHSGIELRRGKRGQLKAKFNPRRWSFQSTFGGMIMVAVGVLLLGGLQFFGGH